MSFVIQKRVLACVKPCQLSQVRHGTSIPVLLLKEVDNRGKEGEVVDVKRGFARNYLIPRKMAVYATKENKTRLVQTSAGKSSLRPIGEIDVATQLRSISADKLVINAFTNWNGTLFVTPTDVRKMLEANGVFVNLKAIIDLGAPIKTAGMHTVTVDGHALQVSVVGVPSPHLRAP